MRWLKEQVDRSARPRTVVLAALLIVTLVWVGSQAAAPRKREALRPAAPAAAPDFGSARGHAKGTSPEGWGRDPFDPERPGSTHRR